MTKSALICLFEFTKIYLQSQNRIRFVFVPSLMPSFSRRSGHLSIETCVPTYFIDILVESLRKVYGPETKGCLVDNFTLEFYPEKNHVRSISRLALKIAIAIQEYQIQNYNQRPSSSEYTYIFDGFNRVNFGGFFDLSKN
jgi:hypothetical protein